MTNCLFYYRRRVKTENSEDYVYNDNFLNPLNVISMYWQDTPEGKKQLSVFLANNFTVTLPEQVGLKCVQHMEDFLRYMISAPVSAPRQHYEKQNTHNQPRTARRAIEAEIVEEEPQINQPANATWDN